MKYELAKKLKDAGFPHSNTWKDKSHWFERESHVVPTLSELIEACGEKFGYLFRTSEDEWGAWGQGCFEQIGNIPEEAVANLWLELNKKDG